ncbi:MAG: 50S ribosomal protein L35 [Candidatus Moranbacteria bacterium]|nr:50S ribosomal protein L35 [Candidatus Moranbacteria bacterium]
MPKIKSRKSLVKKVRVTKSKKVMMRATKQNHYNSKQTGDEKRRKRNDQRLFKTDEKNVLRAIQ